MDPAVRYAELIQSLLYQIAAHPEGGSQRFYCPLIISGNSVFNLCNSFSYLIIRFFDPAAIGLPKPLNPIFAEAFLPMGNAPLLNAKLSSHILVHSAIKTIQDDFGSQGHDWIFPVGQSF